MISLLAVKLPVPACRGLGGIGNNGCLLAGAQVLGNPAFRGFTGYIRNGSVGYRFSNRGNTAGGCMVDGQRRGTTNKSSGGKAFIFTIRGPVSVGGICPDMV